MLGFEKFIRRGYLRHMNYRHTAQIAHFGYFFLMKPTTKILWLDQNCSYFFIVIAGALQPKRMSNSPPLIPMVNRQCTHHGKYSGWQSQAQLAGRHN